MKTIKVCGRRASLYLVAGSCLIVGPLVGGCAVPEKIPYRHVIYKATYNYLRAAECQNTADQQTAYEPCVKSYAEDYESYRKLREQYVNRAVRKAS